MSHPNGKTYSDSLETLVERLAPMDSEEKPAEAPSCEELRPMTEGPPQRAVTAFSPPAIRVVGVGGGGCNAVARMMEIGMAGVEFVAVNTDAQSLLECAADRRLHIGTSSTRGLGAGADPEVGRRAVEENRDELRAALQGSDMVFIATGMGGGTGTGASPVVAEIAQELGILTVAIVTRPFSFEGLKRQRSAEEGINQIRDHVDALIVISNDRLVSTTEKRMSIVGAFHLADDVLRAGVQGICDIIRLPGRVNVDFADVQTVLRRSGSAIIGIGRGSGDMRAMEAAQAAINSPLLDTSFQGARGILLNISGGTSLSLHEVDEAARVIAGAAHPEANIIYGVVVDDTRDDGPEDEIVITVVASGFAEAVPMAEPAPPQYFLATAGAEAPEAYEMPAFLRRHTP